MVRTHGLLGVWWARYVGVGGVVCVVQRCNVHGHQTRTPMPCTRVMDNQRHVVCVGCCVCNEQVAGLWRSSRKTPPTWYAHSKAPPGGWVGAAWCGTV